jgi:hypothetical protein
MRAMVAMMVLVASGLAYAEPATLEPPKPPKQEDEAAKKAEELVKPHKEVYDKAVQAAKEKYKKVLEAEFDKATKAGDLDEAKALQQEMENADRAAVDPDRTSVKSNSVKVAMLRFKQDVSAAKKKYSLEINKLVVAAVKDKKLDVAEKLKGLDLGGFVGKWILFNPSGKAEGYACYADDMFTLYTNDGKIRPDWSGKAKPYHDGCVVSYTNGRTQTHQLMTDGSIKVLETGWYLKRP